MQGHSLELGKLYALRHPAGVDPPGMIKVSMVGPVRVQKVKVRYAEGELEGLEEWAALRSLDAEWRASTRVVMQWIGVAATNAVDKELTRMRSLVEEAIRMLRAAGDDRGAQRLQRAVRPRP